MSLRFTQQMSFHSVLHMCTSIASTPSTVTDWRTLPTKCPSASKQEYKHEVIKSIKEDGEAFDVKNFTATAYNVMDNQILSNHFQDNTLLVT